MRAEGGRLVERALRWRSSGVVVLVLMVAGLAGAADWSELTRRGEWLFASGELSEAERVFEQALAVAESDGNLRRVEVSLDNLARLLQHRQRFAEARPLLERLVALERDRLGPNHSDRVASLNALGNSARAVGDRQAAVEAFSTAIEIAEAAGDSVDPDRYRFALSGLAAALAGGESPAAAIPVYRRLLDERVKAFGSDDAETLAALESLANLEMQQGSGDEAARLFRQLFECQTRQLGREAAAIALAENAASMLGSGHVAAATAMAETALAAFPEAELLKAVETLAGASWLEVRIAAPSVDVVLDGATGPSPELDLARERHRRLERLQAEQLGAAHAKRAETLGRIAMIEARRGDLQGTLTAERDLIELYREAGSGELAGALGILARLERRAGNLDAAVVANTEHLQLLQQRHGEHAAELVQSLELQVELLRSLDRKREARPYKKQLREVERRLRGR